MSHSEHEQSPEQAPKEPKPAAESTQLNSAPEEAPLENAGAKVSEAPTPGEASEATADGAKSNQNLSQDPRFSRLMRAQNRYVTDEALRDTEEKAKPPKPEPQPEPEFEDEGYDDFDDEEFDDDYDDDFDDDDYEDDEGLSEEVNSDETVTSTPAPAASEDPPSEQEEPESSEADHRVAQLRKFNKQFVSEDDLDVDKMLERKNLEEIPREVKVSLVVCPNCQAEAPRGQKMCSECGAKLPKILVQEERYNPGTMNVALKKYFDAVKKLKDKSMSIDEFREFLEARRDLSERQIDELYALIEEGEATEWFPQATGLIFESTQMLENSIQTMMDKLTDTEAEHKVLDEEFLELLEAFEESEEEDEELEPPEPPPDLEDMIRGIDFQPDLESINKSKDMLLQVLRIIDEFQRQAREDLEVSF